MSPRLSQPSGERRASAPRYLYVVRVLRMKISPTVPGGSSSKVSGSSTFISPVTHRPTDPRWANHSSPRMMVTAWASVPAYNSKIFSPPNQLHHSSFNHGGHGAAMCHTVVSDERS